MVVGVLLLLCIGFTMWRIWFELEKCVRNLPAGDLGVAHFFFFNVIFLIFFKFRNLLKKEPK